MDESEKQKIKAAIALLQDLLQSEDEEPIDSMEKLKSVADKKSAQKMKE